MPEAPPQDIASLFSSGRVHPLAVGKTLDQLAHSSASTAATEGRIPHEQMDDYSAKVRASLERHTGSLENMAYRAGGNVDAPVSPLEMGLKGVEGVATPYMLGNAMHYGRRAAAPWLNKDSIGKLVNEGRTPQRAKAVVDRAIRAESPRATLKSSVKSFLTLSLPGVALSQLGTLARPFSDPKYKRGERGYLSSWWEGQKGDAERLGQKAEEATQRYGAAGVPLQMLHGFLNPVSSLVYGGNAVKNYFTRDNTDKATRAVGAALH